MNQQYSQQCQLGNFGFSELPAHADNGDILVSVSADFTIDESTRILLNRAALRTDDVFGVKVCNTQEVTFYLQLEPTVADLPGTLQQWTENLRKALTEDPHPVQKPTIVYSDVTEADLRGV